MQCPKCEQSLEKFSIQGVSVDRCQHCGGVWFGKDELQQIRDERDENLGWLDFDLWSDANQLESEEGGFIGCPNDGKNLFKIKYGSSGVTVDVCLDCRGVWLDKGELDKILEKLADRVNSETLPEYLKDLGEELKELLFEKGNSREEIRNILILMKLIEYRLIAQHPRITEITSALPD